MKRFISIVIGLTMLASPLGATAQGTDLYDRVKKITEQELFPEKESDELVKAFVRAAEPSIGGLDLDAALQQRYNQLCAGKKGTEGYLTCLETANRIGRMIGNEERIRAFGRELQMIATSYEMPLALELGGDRNLLYRLPSIIKIWQSGTDRYLTPVVEAPIRTLPMPKKRLGG